MADWERISAIAKYPGFVSHLEMLGNRTRFVITAEIENASEVPKLRQYIECMAAVLALPKRGIIPDEIEADWAEP